MNPYRRDRRQAHSWAIGYIRAREGGPADPVPADAFDTAAYYRGWDAGRKEGK